VLYNLHLLRVIAALGVVYFHTTSTAGLRLGWDIGSRGVDVFFVISGFIIAYIATSKPDQFFVRRLIRVAPFYWAATLAVFAIARVAPHVFHTTTADPHHLFASLAFIPHMNAATGEMMPTLLLGWSLNFEMFFYVLFALALRVDVKWSPLICVAGLVPFVIITHVIFAGRNDILDFYARPIVLEFCYGIAAFYAFRWCSERKAKFVPALKWVLLAILVASFVLLGVLEEYYRDRVPRYLVAGIPAFFIVLSALLLERIYGLTTKNKLVYLLGESSYIIYLVHPYIVFTVLRLAVKDAELSTPMLAALIVGLLALTSAISIAIHTWFEKPVMAMLRARLT
jgi:exopolysaccharide production protein ExoZ